MKFFGGLGPNVGTLCLPVVLMLLLTIGIPWNVLYIQIYSKISIHGFRTLA